MGVVLLSLTGQFRPALCSASVIDWNKDFRRGARSYGHCGSGQGPRHTCYAWQHGGAFSERGRRYFYASAGGDSDWWTIWNWGLCPLGTIAIVIMEQGCAWFVSLSCPPLVFHGEPGLASLSICSQFFCLLSLLWWVFRQFSNSSGSFYTGLRQCDARHSF